MISDPNLTIKINDISFEELVQIHKECDNDFIPKLSTRVDIKEYCKKLHRLSEILSLILKDKIIGLVAIYCNDNVTREAFISSVCLLEKFRGYGYSNILIKEAVNFAKEKGMKNVKLEVGINNVPAINLYYKFNFQIIETKFETYIMKLNEF